MCTERKATGVYVLACFMFATMHECVHGGNTNFAIFASDRDGTA